MKKLYFILILLFSLIIHSNLVSATIQYIKLSRGGGSGKVQFTVNAPLSSARSILDDDQAFIKFIPGIKNWKVVKESSLRQIAKCTMSMSSLIPPSHYLVQIDKVSADELRFKRLSGDLKDLEGSWKLSNGKAPNTTVVTYQYSIDTGLNNVPKIIMRRELEKHLKETEIRSKSELNKFISSPKAN